MSVVALPVAVTGVLLITSLPASAQISQLAIGAPTLGPPKGATISVPLNFTCDVGQNVAFGDVFMTQVSGHKLSQGAGNFENPPPGVPCTGAPESVTVSVVATGAFTFKSGTAVASADLTVFDPVSGALTTDSVTGQAVRITP
jgi:hypothetical protein